MPSLRASLLALVIAAVAAVPASAAAPKVVSHEYLVQFTLSGHYKAVTVYRAGDPQFCPGTGYTEDAEFGVTLGQKLKVTLQGTGLVGKKALPSMPESLWSINGTGVFAGDSCDQIHQETCTGRNQLGRDGTSLGTNVIAATGRKKQIVFSAKLAETPAEHSVNEDCAQNTDIAPVVSFNLGDALAPYDDVSFGISLVKLAKQKVGQKIVGTANVRDFPSGYNVSTCNGNDPCVGSFSHLVRTITVTRKS